MTWGPPRWASPHRVVWTTPIARLRDFTDGATDDVVPTLMLPPQAGHDSCIVDYSPEQSQVEVAKAAGLVDSVGGRANLVGDCQGGWLATIYTALRPERVNTLTIAGAPIDFAAGQPQIADRVSSLGSGDPAFYRTWSTALGACSRGSTCWAGS